MPSYASTTVATMRDGILYANAMPLTGTESDLFGGTGAAGNDPVDVRYGQCVIAIVQFTITGSPGANTSYVVMQHSLDGGTTWIDLAWCVDTSLSGTQTFVLCAGSSGANAFQNSRVAGTAPYSTSFVQCPLAGNLRFVGMTQLSGGSSPAVAVTVRYKLMGLR